METPPAPFAIGDKVQFTKATQKGNGIDFKTLTGKIERLSQPTGKKALIKYHGGNTIWVFVCNLRRLDQPSLLTDLVKAMAAATKADPGS